MIMSTTKTDEIELREDGTVQIRMGTSEGICDLIFTDEEQFYKFTAGQHRDAAHKIIRKLKQRLVLHCDEGLTVRQLHRYLSRFVDKMSDAPVALCLNESDTNTSRIVGASREPDGSVLWLKVSADLQGKLYKENP